MSPHNIEPTIVRATGGVHPLDVTFIDDEDLATPWKRDTRSLAKIPGATPKSLTVTLANLFYFEKAELPQPLANRPCCVKTRSTVISGTSATPASRLM
jgi:hypothetical protein